MSALIIMLALVAALFVVVSWIAGVMLVLDAAVPLYKSARDVVGAIRERGGA